MARSDKRKSSREKRIASMEEEVDKWRSTMKDAGEDGEARFYCPNCLVQSKGSQRMCGICGGPMVPVGTPPAEAKRMIEEGYTPPPPPMEPAGGAGDDGGPDESPEGDDPGEDGEKEVQDEGGDEKRKDGGRAGEDLRDEREENGGGELEDAEGEEGGDAGEETKRGADATEEGEGEKIPLRTCPNCGSGDLEMPDGGPLINCRTCGGVYRVLND